MRRFIYKTISIFFCLIYSISIVPMDPPEKPKKILTAADARLVTYEPCVKTFQVFNLKKAEVLRQSAESIVPQDLTITSDEKSSIMSGKGGQVIFRKMGALESPELIAVCFNMRGAPMVAVGTKKVSDGEEMVIAVAGNYKEPVSFYQPSELYNSVYEQFLSEFRIYTKKNPYSTKNTRPSCVEYRLKSSIQEIAINNHGANIVATIEMTEEFSKQNRSSLVIRDIEKDQMNGYWSHEGSWFRNVVINDEGTMVVCTDIHNHIWLFDIVRNDDILMLSLKATVPTGDSIKQINYPSKIRMWYVTDNNEFKTIDMRKYLGTCSTKDCVSSISSVAPDINSNSLVVMDKCPFFSVACWLENGTDIFVTREKDSHGKEAVVEKITCSMGQCLSGENVSLDSHLRKMSKKIRIQLVALRANQLAAVGSNGRMRVFQLLERCGLVTRPRSNSEPVASSRKGMVDKKTQESSSDDVIKKLPLDSVAKQNMARSASPGKQRAMTSRVTRSNDTKPSINIACSEPQKAKEKDASKKKRFSATDYKAAAPKPAAPKEGHKQTAAQIAFNKALLDDIMADQRIPEENEAKKEEK